MIPVIIALAMDATSAQNIAVRADHALHAVTSKDRAGERSERIRSVFDSLGSDTLDSLDQLYDQTVVFEDPLGELNGLEALQTYYARLYERVQSVTFEYTDEIVAGDSHVLFWTMEVRPKKMNDGNKILVEGNSSIEFGPSNKVSRHRDYFDMGDLIYRHAFFVGRIIKKIDNRLRTQDHE